MLCKKTSFSSHTSSSPTPSPIPARPKTSTSHYQPHHDTSGVRRAFSSLQNALHPARRSSSDEKRSGVTVPDHEVGLGGKGLGGYSSSISGRSSTYRIPLSHSNGTTDSFYSSGSNMTPLTTDDDSSSIASHPLRLQRPRQSSKSGSLPSPLGSFLSNGSSIALSARSSQVTETASQDHGPGDGNDASGNHSHGVTSPTVGSSLQLRVRHLERGASYSGYLTKFSSRTFFSRKQWKRRYFVLHQASLHCFKSSDPQHPLLESLKLCPDTIICVTDIFSGKRYCLQITSPGEKNWYVLADTAAEMSGWLRELKGTVLRFRGLSLDSRPGTHYSDSSEMSDLSSSSVAMTDGAPAMPRIPSQYEAFTFVNRSPSSPPPRPPHPSHQLDLHHCTSSDNPVHPSRAGTPKPPLPTSEVGPGQDTRRRKNSSLSSGQAPLEYASFGTVMEQADALPLEGDRRLGFPALSSSIIPRHRRGSGVPDFSGAAIGINSSGGNGRRISIVVERPETMITLPRRSSQRLMGSPSHPMSPVSSRPTSPSFNRPSPRSSLVVSPPPRSIHRPSNVSARHSTQVLPSEMAMQSSGIFVRSFSPTSDHSSETLQGSLSRVTSLRGSMITGSLQERSYRSPSRPSIVTGYSRPLSPAPSFSSAPTSPLPDPPRSESPTRALKHSLSNGSSHRIPIVPRHHDPEQLSLKHRNSKTRSRSKSQELCLSVRPSDLQLPPRATTPSPRLGAIVTSNDALPTPPLSPTSGPRAHCEGACSKHISLLHNGSLVLPPPPTGQQPEPPSSGASSTASSPSPSRPSSSLLQHKHSLSNSSLRSVGSSSSIGSHSAACFGGSVSKKHHSRESSTLSARLSTLAPIPLGSAASVPSPPLTALPPIPLPRPPASAPPAVPIDWKNEADKELSQNTSDELPLQNAPQAVLGAENRIVIKDELLGKRTISNQVEKQETPGRDLGSMEIDVISNCVDMLAVAKEDAVKKIETAAELMPADKSQSGYEIILEEEETEQESVVSLDMSVQMNDLCLVGTLPSVSDAALDKQIEFVEPVTDDQGISAVAKELDLAEQSVPPATSLVSA